MKSLAATILSQRSDTEQFFLESLQEVREVIRKERLQKQTQFENKQLMNKLKHGGGSTHTTFPPLNVKGAHLHHLGGKYATELTAELSGKAGDKVRYTYSSCLISINETPS